MEYKKLAKEILNNVGGKSNIAEVTHCFTRLRITLKDYDKMNKDELDKISIVKGSQVNSGQLQIIIGNEVDDLYKSFLEVTGLGESEESGSNKSLLGRFIDMITAIFIPVFPALVAGGLMKGILLALQFSEIVDPAGSTFQYLSIFADAPFYFLPIILAYSAAKKFKCNPYLAVVIAGIMLHPNLSALADGSDFLGISVPVVNYSSTVFPILIGVYVMSWIEKFAKKVSPKSLAMLIVPLLTIFITAPIVLILIGPAANTLSLWVADGIAWLFDTTGLFAGLILGAAYPFLVFTGLHQAIPPIQLLNLAETGQDIILAVCACGNAAVAGATLGYAIKTKTQQSKSLASSSSLSAFIGITEPAIYGVITHYKSTIIACLIGGGVGGAIVSFFKVTAVGMGPVPLAGIALFAGNKFIYYVLGFGLSAIIACLIVLVLYKDKNNKEEMKPVVAELGKENQNIIYSPIKGKCVLLSKVNDETFSKEIMGKGVAIIPTEGKVYAPIDGEVTVVFPTKHAIGISSGDIDVVIHVGIDTVKLEGKYFTSFIKPGDKIKKGDLLLSFDQEKIEAEGYDLITPVIISNSMDFKDIRLSNINHDVSNSKTIIEIIGGIK